MNIDDFGATSQKWGAIQNGTSHIALAHWDATAVASSSLSYNASKHIVRVVLNPFKSKIGENGDFCINW